MSDVIRLLPDSVANQIAAGEVVQRPANVIKELVENSIDAGATDVTIILKDAGRTLIQVIDNGCGMSDTDARLAFERHATSKIREAADLFALHTMGFRGEALASIAAIAQIDLRTQLKDASLGTRIVINGSKVESQAPEACTPGSNLMVKNLFYNLPARRKFLRKDSVELSHIMREFERMALVNTDVDFTLISNDVTLHNLRRSSFKQRIVSLFGKSLDKQIIPVETDTSIVRLNGFISLPENCRKRNPLQYLMVNGRNMRHPYFHKAILQCYDKLIPADEQPNYFIKMTVDPETIDVNIHPTKNEIKFENEQAIWQILVASVRESLSRFAVGPSIDFNVDEMPEIPAFDPNSASADVSIKIDTSYNPFNPQPAARQSQSTSATRVSSFNSSGARFQDWEKLYDDFVKKRDEGYASAAPAVSPDSDGEKGATPTLDLDTPLQSATLQLHDTYILTPSRGGLMVIDQHRAHERILFDTYLAKVRERAFVCQASMFPEIVELSPSQDAILSSIISDLEPLGFNLAPLGGHSWSINGAPSALAGANPRDTLLGMIETVTESGENLGDGLQEKIALGMARANAIKRGQPLSVAEMDRLISELFVLPVSATTPDGNPVFTIIPLADIAKLF